MFRTALILTASLSCLTLAGCIDGKSKTPASSAAAPAMPVKTMTLHASDLPVTLQFVAKTESSRAVTINSRVSGFLSGKPYEEGAFVKAGDTLFEIDRKPFEVQVTQVEAALASAQASHTVARANLTRLRQLSNANAVSQSALDDAIARERTAAAAVKEAQARLSEAQLNLSYATIRSPIDGLAGAATQAEGTFISAANSTLTTVYALSPIWVTFSMSENQYLALSEQLRSGAIVFPKNYEMGVRVELANGEFARDTGSISFVSPAFDSSTGTFKLRASLKNEPRKAGDTGPGQLRPNQFVRVHITGALRPKAIAVPQGAVQQGAHGNYVWLAREGRARMQPVKTGDWIGQTWHITEGLKDGDELITEGFLRLAPDAPITVVNNKAAAK